MSASLVLVLVRVFVTIRDDVAKDIALLLSTHVRPGNQGHDEPLNVMLRRGVDEWCQPGAMFRVKRRLACDCVRQRQASGGVEHVDLDVLVVSLPPDSLDDVVDTVQLLSRLP